MLTKRRTIILNVKIPFLEKFEGVIRRHKP